MLGRAALPVPRFFVADVCTGYDALLVSVAPLVQMHGVTMLKAVTADGADGELGTLSRSG